MKFIELTHKESEQPVSLNVSLIQEVGSLAISDRTPADGAFVSFDGNEPVLQVKESYEEVMSMINAATAEVERAPDPKARAYLSDITWGDAKRLIDEDAAKYDGSDPEVSPLSELVKKITAEKQKHEAVVQSMISDEIMRSVAARFSVVLDKSTK